MNLLLHPSKYVVWDEFRYLNILYRNRNPYKSGK